MRITGISTHVAGTPWRNLTFVQVHTDEGLVGVGEARMLNHTDALIGYLAEAERNHVAGSDPFDTEDLVRRMKYGDYGRAREIVMSGIACVEMACWDIVGKALGQPVRRLLGGKVRERIKAYANGWYTVERTPAAFHAAAKKVVERGYQALKFDPFGNGTMELDHAETMRSVSLVEAVRDAIGEEAEHFNDFADSAIKGVAPGLPEVVDGYFALPEGLGVELDLDALAEFHSQRADFNLFAENWHLRDPAGTK
jgi:galactonate dehydratase